MTGTIVAHSGEFSVVAQKLATPAERLGYIDWVEQQLLQEVQAPMALDHNLLDGLYTRTMIAPEGTMLTGAIHKKGCLTLLMRGSISVITADGAALMTGPLIFQAAAGVRRLGYCHTEVVWATVHAVQSTNLDDIEAELFE